MKQNLTIGWLYPELMSTYGDRGNIITLQKRCQWRNITSKIMRLDFGFRISDLKACDMLFMGGAQDRQQKIVSDDLSKEKVKILQEMIEDKIPGLYICGAYQFLGKYYKEADGTIIPGLDILDLYTENPGENHERLIGNIVAEINFDILRVSDSESISQFSTSRGHSNECSNNTIVGFENHGGRTYLGKNIQPLGKVIKGFGNNEKGGTEGAVYKNSIGTYMHGPILPKNPHLADFLIQRALEKKYKKTIDLSPLDDSLERQAHEEVLKKFQIPQ